MPSVGVARAVDEITQFAIWGGTELEVALRAGALCMLVPSYSSARILPPATPTETDTDRRTQSPIPPVKEISPVQGGGEHNPGSWTKPPTVEASSLARRLTNDAEELTDTFVPVSLYLTQIHGQYPTDLRQSGKQSGARAADPETGAPAHLEFSLIAVPSDFKVGPITGGGRGPRNRYDATKKWCKDFVKSLRKHSDSTSSRNSIQGAQTKSSEKSGANHHIKPQGNLSLAKSEVYLASTFSFIKTICAIIQIIYGSFELYQISSPQLHRYGYASYQLTVIPYIIMSLANLVAGLTCPRYPSRYLVHYHGLYHPEDQKYSGSEEYPLGWWGGDERLQVENSTSGVVGLVYGEFLKKDDAYMLPADERARLRRRTLLKDYPKLGKIWEALMDLTFKTLAWTFLQGILLLAFTAAPYIILQILTKFDAGQSTVSQRSWIMCWFVLGQLGSMMLSFVLEHRKFQRFAGKSPIPAFLLTAVVTALLSVSTMGGFVVVAQMMLEDTTCRRV